RMQELGFAIALYANLPLVVSMHAIRQLLEVLSRNGGIADSPPFASWDERQAVVRKDYFDALGDRYAAAASAQEPGVLNRRP
ncbi:MAG: 2,3-dimethylmalate lyase, partial [Mycobacterium sp.]|nr:2,3-dimethylmalate lyase [Mycobacterium sp.]